MPRGTKELETLRRDEIITACEQLYETKSFKEITIKEIGEHTSFTRTSIYNYFQTKEEIFLALLQKEYELWVDELQKAIDTHEKMSRQEIAETLALSLSGRRNLLKLLSMNHYDMEENSSLVALTEFKAAYRDALDAVRNILIRFLPDMDEEEREKFIFSFFPFMFGIYPYVCATEKQKRAMSEAKVKFKFMGIYEITLAAAEKLLGI